MDRTELLLEHGIDIRTRTVWLPSEVNEDMLLLVSKSLRLFAGKSVTFMLNSEGGDEDSGLAICDLIRTHGARVTIVVTGTAQSMAAVILQAAHVRKITRSSFIMLHSGSLGVDEMHKKNVKAYIRICEKQDDMCDVLVLKRIQKKYPKYSWNQFRQETNFDTYFTADQALTWSLVDRVI